MKRRSFITYALTGLASLPLLSRLITPQTALPEPATVSKAITVHHGLGFQPALIIVKRNHAFDVQAIAK